MSNAAVFKLKVVEFVEKSGNRRAERIYRVCEKLVQDWRKKMAFTTLPISVRSHVVEV